MKAVIVVMLVAFLVCCEARTMPDEVDHPQTFPGFPGYTGSTPALGGIMPGFGMFGSPGIGGGMMGGFSGLPGFGGHPHSASSLIPGGATPVGAAHEGASP